MGEKTQPLIVFEGKICMIFLFVHFPANAQIQSKLLTKFEFFCIITKDCSEKGIFYG